MRQNEYDTNIARPQSKPLLDGLADIDTVIQAASDHIDLDHICN